MKASTALLSALSLASAALATAPALADGVPAYQVAKTVTIGAPDRWDYVVYDPPSHRVYVSHGDRVTVVDGQTGEIVGNVEGFPGGTHGIAISHANGRGYTDDGGAGEAGAFDLKTLKVGKRIKTAEDADGMAADPVTGHVFTVNGDTGAVTAIDPKTDTAVATINGGGKLEYAVASGDGKLYVNGAEKKEIVRIDTRTNTVDAHWPIPNCTSPHGLAADKAGHRLFSTCVNGLMVVVNTDTGATVASLPIGAGTDAAAFDPRRKLAFSSNGRDGTLSVIQQKDPNTYVALEPVKTVVTARTMDIDPQTGRIFLVAADIDQKAAAELAAQASAPGSAPPRRRGPPFVAGSTKLIFLDPVK